MLQRVNAGDAFGRQACVHGGDKTWMLPENGWEPEQFTCNISDKMKDALVLKFLTFPLATKCKDNWMRIIFMFRVIGFVHISNPKY